MPIAPKKRKSAAVQRLTSERVTRGSAKKPEVVIKKELEDKAIKEYFIQYSDTPKIETLQDKSPLKVVPTAAPVESSDLDSDLTELNMDPLTPTPTAKRQKTNQVALQKGTLVKELIPPLSSMKWVHDEMKSDLEEAFRLTDKEFQNACNFWYRYICWKKRDLTKIDKDHFCQAAFGTHAVQLQYSESGAKGKGNSNEPIGLRVHKQWSAYPKNVFREL